MERDQEVKVLVDEAGWVVIVLEQAPVDSVCVLNVGRKCPIKWEHPVLLQVVRNVVHG